MNERFIIIIMRIKVSERSKVKMMQKELTKLVKQIKDKKWRQNQRIT